MPGASSVNTDNDTDYGCGSGGLRGLSLRSMLALLATLVDIARCQRGPQDLPASWTLLGLLLVCYAVLSFVQARLSGWTLAGVVPLIVVEALMLLTWVWALLAFFGHRARYLQTMAAVLGIAILLVLADLALLVAGHFFVIPRSVSDAWILIRLFVMVLLVGRVLMLAIEGGMLTGFAFTMMMILSIIYVGQMFIPGA